MTRLTPTEQGASDTTPPATGSGEDGVTCSPDLDPTELLWDQLGRADAARMTNIA